MLAATAPLHKTVKHTKWAANPEQMLAAKGGPQLEGYPTALSCISCTGTRMLLGRLTNKKCLSACISCTADTDGVVSSGRPPPFTSECTLGRHKCGPP